MAGRNGLDLKLGRTHPHLDISSIQTSVRPYDNGASEGLLVAESGAGIYVGYSLLRVSVRYVSVNFSTVLFFFTVYPHRHVVLIELATSMHSYPISLYTRLRHWLFSTFIHIHPILSPDRHALSELDSAAPDAAHASYEARGRSLHFNNKCDYNHGAREPSQSSISPGSAINPPSIIAG